VITQAFGYRVEITDEVRALARTFYPKDRDFSKTDLGIEAPIVGAFGEAVFATAATEIGLGWDYVGDRRIYVEGEYQSWDFETPVGTVEVKAKASHYRPHSEFFAGFSEAALVFEKADLFVFVSLFPKASEEDAWSYQEGYVVGWTTRLDFLDRASFEPVGTIMGGGRPSTRPMRTLKVKELIPFSGIAGGVK
jgi:hypothetical protein